MKAVIYTRVSTDEQVKEGFSLNAQHEKCMKYIELQEWEYITEYKDDGYSAKNLKRPAMQKMLQDMEHKQFELVVIYRLDRMVRRVSDLHYLMDLFRKYDIKFVSITEHFDTTTATGRLFMTNVAALAQWERENLAERVRMGQEQRALQGGRNGATPPYGYRSGEGNSLIIDPFEAEIVQRIFKMYLSSGCHTIAKTLNSEGTRTKSGYHWVDAAVDYVLDNIVYTGKIRWGYRKDVKGGKRKRKANKENWIIYDGTHEPIISQELWEETQQLRKMRRERFYASSPKALTTDYPFSSVAVCNRCGHGLQGTRKKTKRGYRYSYICPGNYKQSICDLPSIPEISIEKEFISYLDNIFKSDDLENYRNPVKQQPTSDNSILQQIDEIKKTRRKWQIAFGQDLITIEELQSLITESRSKEKKLLKMLNTQQDEPQPLTQDELISALSDTQKTWESMDRSEKKHLILALVKTITIDSPVKEKGYGNKSRITPCTIDRIIFN